ncbi:MAG: aminopeptidase N [Moraxellaceae bacterium]|nr:aminopeptidase N [Moraxellaceae bacterium]
MTTESIQKTIYLKDYQSPFWCISHVRLHISIGSAATEVTAELDISRADHTPSDMPLRLHGAGLELLSLEINAQPVDARGYHYEGEELVITHIPEGDFTLKSRVRIYPDRNTALEGLYASNGMYCTQCEAEGFRKITYYLDRPDVMARFTTTVEADRDRFPVLLANGNPVASGDLEDGRHFVTWEDPFPKPSYLFAAVAGDLALKQDHFVTASGRKVNLRIYVEPHDLEKVDHAMSSLKRSMRWDEETYGREYDLDIFMIVAVSHFNMGAMENKGLNIFNTSCVLAHPLTTTDSGFQRVESVVAHEYFHNWSGNRVTCRDWFQLSLKEGFTVFRDQQFSADMLSASVQRIEDVNMLRTWQFAEDSGPLAHPVRPESFVEINNFYTATVYEKGAEIVRMLHTVLGDVRFRVGTDLYFSRHDGQAVTVEDFIAALSDASGMDLSDFMQWYRQPGTPVLRAVGAYDPVAHTYTLKLSQSVPAIPGFVKSMCLPIPIRMALIGPDGEDLAVKHNELVATQHVLVLREASKEFIFSGVGLAPVPSLLRDFSAPVKLEQSLSAQERLFLLQHDSNGFNRWLIAQELLTAELVRLADSGGQCDDLLVSAMTLMLPELAEQDAALAAKLLQLPSVHQLMDQTKTPDPDRLQSARLKLKGAIAASLESWFVPLCEQQAAPAYIFSAEAIAHRALANTALGFLVDFSPSYAALAVQRFTTAQNMTDEAAALTVLVHAGRPEALSCLEAFMQRWKHEALVLDQWFAIQASAPLSATNEQVRQLLAHPAFDRGSPNRVRSLLGQFANANPVAFHQKNGEGYRLLCSQVGELDVQNPQLAARLLGAMAVWPRLDKGRQALALSALASFDRAGLSSDLAETLSRLQHSSEATS